MTARINNSIIISGLITILWVVLILTSALEWYDLKIFDFFMSHSAPIQQDSSIIVVEHDDKTAENLTSPATRLDMAALIHIIEQYHPKVVALDLFSLHGLLNGVDSATLFENLLSRYDNVCYGIGFIVPTNTYNDPVSDNHSTEFSYLEKYLYSIDSVTGKQTLFHAEHLFMPVFDDFSHSKSLGHLVLKNDADGIFRRIPACIQCDNGALLTLGLQAAFDYRGIAKKKVRIRNRKIMYGNPPSNEILIDENGLLMVRYNDRRNKILEVSMIDVFNAYKNGDRRTIDPAMFNNKIVFVGNTSSRTARFCPTPLHSYYPSLLIHANVANNVLRNSFVQSLSVGLTILLVALIGIFYATIFIMSKNIFRTSFLLTLPIPLVVLSGYFGLIYGNVYVPSFTLSSFTLALFCCLAVYRYLNYKDILLASLKELQEAMRLKERLATIGEVSSKIAHEIRNPLNAIELYTSLLKRQMAGKEEASAHLEIIHEEAQRLNRFITRLLGYARPKEPVMFPLNLRTEIHTAVQLLLPDAEKKNIRIRYTIPEDISIAGDSDQLHEIFLNLIKNSIEAMSLGGELEIYSETGPDAVKMFFKDSGTGIPPDDIEKIFNPFFSTKERGTGLGLAMVKKIVDYHHGEITVQSEVGKGTIFIIRLPLKKSTA